MLAYGHLETCIYWLAMLKQTCSFTDCFMMIVAMALGKLPAVQAAVPWEAIIPLISSFNAFWLSSRLSSWLVLVFAVDSNSWMEASAVYLSSHSKPFQDAAIPQSNPPDRPKSPQKLLVACATGMLIIWSCGKTNAQTISAPRVAAITHLFGCI